MCVRDVDVQCVLQFTLVNAAGCALHRRTSRVIHRLESYLASQKDFRRRRSGATRPGRPSGTGRGPIPSKRTRQCRWLFGEPSISTAGVGETSVPRPSHGEFLAGRRRGRPRVASGGDNGPPRGRVWNPRKRLGGEFSQQARRTRSFPSHRAHAPRGDAS